MAYKEMKTFYIPRLWSLKFGKEHSETGQEPLFIELKKVGHF